MWFFGRKKKKAKVEEKENVVKVESVEEVKAEEVVEEVKIEETKPAEVEEVKPVAEKKAATSLLELNNRYDVPVDVTVNHEVASEIKTDSKKLQDSKTPRSESSISMETKTSAFGAKKVGCD